MPYGPFSPNQNWFTWPQGHRDLLGQVSLRVSLCLVRRVPYLLARLLNNRQNLIFAQVTIVLGIARRCFIQPIEERLSLLPVALKLPVLV